jgi:hypothetical protein
VIVRIHHQFTRFSKMKNTLLPGRCIKVLFVDVNASVLIQIRYSSPPILNFSFQLTDSLLPAPVKIQTETSLGTSLKPNDYIVVEPNPPFEWS